MTDPLTGANPSGLDVLLRALDADRNEAGARYERLRRKLLKFFLWEQCGPAEELADTCLDRLARKLSEGAVTENIEAYAGGIARMVLKEHHAREERSRVIHHEFGRRQQHLGSDADAEFLSAQLEECLGQLSAENQSLIRRYYLGSQSERIRNRQQLASELNLSLNALRNRAMRLREGLEECMSRSRRDRSAETLTKSGERR